MQGCICGKECSKSYKIVSDHCHNTSKYRGAAHSIYKLEINMSNEIYVVFPNDSNCYYHFIIKELANEFEGKLECSNRKRSYKN